MINLDCLKSPYSEGITCAHAFVRVCTSIWDNLNGMSIQTAGFLLDEWSATEPFYTHWFSVQTLLT